jgi:hypothetical protein
MSFIWHRAEQVRTGGVSSELQAVQAEVEEARQQVARLADGNTQQALALEQVSF